MTELSDRDRMIRALLIGWHADNLFRRECQRLGLSFDDALRAPVLAIAARQLGLSIRTVASAVDVASPA